MSNLLFICSKNQWRSPTAELLFRDHPIHIARSAGTSDKARIRINQRMIDWADIIFLMERRHLELIKERFNLKGQVLNVLHIEDKYHFNDKQLIELLKISLENYLKRF